LRGIGGRIADRTKSSAGEGFPIKLPGSAWYDIKPLNQRFALLTDTYINVYTASGKRIYSLQHGFSNPVSKTSEHRILLFDHNGSDFSVYNFNSKLFSDRFDTENTNDKERIITAEIGKNDYVAVVTTSEKYANILCVYDNDDSKVYIKRFTDEYVNSVSFTENPNELIVTTSGFYAGNIASYAYKINITTEDEYVWKSSLPSNALSLRAKAVKDRVDILCDDRFVALDSKTGELKGEYVFNSDIKKCVIGDNFSLLLLTDYIVGKTVLTAIDKNADVKSAFNITNNLKTIEIIDDNVYILDGNQLIVYDEYANEKRRIELPNEEYTKLIKTGESIVLLGYDDIIRIDSQNNISNSNIYKTDESEKK
jgi:hypothetical protein